MPTIIFQVIFLLFIFCQYSKDTTEFYGGMVRVEQTSKKRFSCVAKIDANSINKYDSVMSGSTKAFFENQQQQQQQQRNLNNNKRRPSNRSNGNSSISEQAAGGVSEQRCATSTDRAAGNAHVARTTAAEVVDSAAEATADADGIPFPINSQTKSDDCGDYPSEIEGGSIDRDDDSEPYNVSSMSDDEEQSIMMTGSGGDGGAGIHSHNTSTAALSGGLESNCHDGNNYERAIPVHLNKMKQKEEQQQLTPLAPPLGGSFSPLGSVNDASTTNGSIMTKDSLNMPKFYDSEDEGVGSLVLVPSMKSLASPQQRVHHQDMGPSTSMATPSPLQFMAPSRSGNVVRDKHTHALTSTTPAHLLPYQQRKKLQQHEQTTIQQQQSEKRPPTVPPPKSSSFGVASVVANESPVTSVVVAGNNAELAKKYGCISEIPPFRGGQRNQLSDNGNIIFLNNKNNNNNAEGMNRSKSGGAGADASSKNTRSPASSSYKQKRPPSLLQQEVICPPPPLQSSETSPGGESYHIRVSSCGSISSLGSVAVDSDSVRHAPRRDHHNSNMQQQQQQQQQQQYYPQMQPPPNHYFGNYTLQNPNLRSSSSGNGGGHPPPNGYNFLDLSQDIAMFLHGEQISSAVEGSSTSPPPSYQHHHLHHPNRGPPPNYWNPSYGWVGGGGGVNLYQKPQHHYPPPPQAEPIPPPLTSVPNMPFHRQRLPSISDDDWSEDIEKYNKTTEEMDGVQKEDVDRGAGRNNGNQPPYPPNQRRYSYGRDRMVYPHLLPPPIQNRGRDHQEQQTKRKKESHQQQHYENHSNERSSLLAPTFGRSYEEYGWNGDNPITIYHTPPRARNNNKKDSQETKSTKRKKSKRRRREKEKLRNNMYFTDSSPEDDDEKQRLRSSRRKKRHGGRSSKRRGYDDVSDTISETYSGSFADRLKSAETNVNFVQRMIIRTKLFICNLPLSASAISFSVVLLGIVWLRRAEENLSSCKEVNFHSSQCNFPELPGCYFCDTFDAWYQVATTFHSVCSNVAGVSVTLYAAKAVLFRRVFIDEMSSPTTGSPAGLVFMTMALAFTGKGAAGAVLVFIASFLHLALLLWFIYMSLAYQTMPDPSWFPNTIGIGLCAVKVWFYNPLFGHFLIAMTLMLMFLYYPISLFRVALNEKMSATICWMQMICPAISLYSLSIIMQPSFKEERPDISHFQTVQRSVYLPSMTCLFGLCIIGMISSLHGVAVRWKQIQKEEFTPAHAAYSFPLLMHALAVQAYRSSLGFFSDTGEVNPALKSVLEIYWIVLISTGTFVALMCLIMYLSFLPSWIEINTNEELEPPAPTETSVFETVTYGESLIQPYVSPTILQSNEAGVLIMTHDYEYNWSGFVRTKKIPAVGFEPMMRKRTFTQEREVLKLIVGGQDVIHEGDEADEDFCFENVNV